MYAVLRTHHYCCIIGWFGCRENSALWREVAQLRQKHAKQQQIVNKVGGLRPWRGLWWTGIQRPVST